MTEEEKQKLEESAIGAREAADAAHAAAADAPGDEALQEAADTAEDAALAAQAAVDAAVVTPAEAPKGEEDEEKGDEDIDFEKELKKIEGEPETPGKKAPTELEKAERALFFQTQRVVELGGDPDKVIKKPAAPPAPAAPAAPATPGEFVTKDDLHKRDLQAQVRSLTRTDAEYKVLMWHTENSIKLTGDPVVDAQNAYMIAHKGRITRSFDEIRRARLSRPMPGAAPGRKPPAAATKSPELSSSDKVAIQRRGFKMQPDGSYESKRYRLAFEKGKGWIQTRKKT